MLQEEQTRHNYSLVWCRFILYLMRTVIVKPPTTSAFPEVTPSLQEACESLWNYLATSNEGCCTNTEEEEKEEQQQQRRRITTAPAVVTTGRIEGQEELRNRAAQQQQQQQLERLLHNVNKAVWCRDADPHELLDTAFYCPVQRFLVLSSLRADGSFLSAKLLTPVIAKLQYWARATVLNEVVELLNASIDERVAEKRRYWSYYVLNPLLSSFSCTPNNMLTSISFCFVIQLRLLLQLRPYVEICQGEKTANTF